MLKPDLLIGRRFAEAQKPPGRILLCAVTGSHHYGFPSPDSDLDLKGIHLAPTEALLGLDDLEETHDRLEPFEGVECDLTSHEARKALKLLLGGNGNLLERILSPFQIYETADLTELQALARKSLSRRFHKHYRGYFLGMRAEHERSEYPRAKTLLYSYRVALTGAHLLGTGELIADLNLTAPEYGFHEVTELIALKQEQGEKAIVPTEQDIALRCRWQELASLLEEALEHSRLPEEAPNRAEIAAWLLDKRLECLR